MSDILDWPALSPGTAALPEEVRYEHGIWGKVPGARTDFRWIARSSGFEREEPGLERQISLGTEEQPEKAQLWRRLDDRCLAVGLYPSRAVDADGRRDFLEKQVLAWPRPEEAPAALGALLLLSRVESLTDEVWWGRRSDRMWEDPAFHLPIPTPDRLPVDREQLDAVLQQGVRELRDSVAPDSLGRLYAQILAGRRPAWLTGLERPLSARALAVLLLPLPRTVADSLSLAGWIPSGRASPEGLAARWDVIVLPPHLRGSIDLGEAHADAEARGRALADGLLDLNLKLVRQAAPAAMAAPPPEPAAIDKQAAQPSRLSPIAALRPRARILLPAPPADASDLLRELHAFAQSVDRRWLDLGDVRPIARLEDVPERLFPCWIEALRQQQPDHASAEQWRVKLDLLRSAALALRPADDTLQSVGLPESRRVPALLFALRLEKRDLLAKRMSEDALRQILRQSLSCQPDPRTREVRRWITEWRGKTNRLGLPALIDRELDAVKAP
jgi:hypothetical protein